MATGVNVWSKTASSNNTADSAVNWQEGQAPSSVNDSARGMMAATAKWRDDLNGTVATSGTSTAYTATSNQGFAALAAGLEITCQFDEDCGATVTLNVDNLGAKPLRPAAGVELAQGAIKAGSIHRATYATSNSGEWLLHSPTTVAAGQVVTASITDKSVTYAKIQDVANNRLLGNVSGGAAAPQEITIGDNLSIDGTTLSADGNVAGPSSAVDANIALFDGATGKLLKDSGINLSGARVLLNTMTASSSSVLTDSTTFTTYGSSFDRFEIVFEQLVPATNGVYFYMEVSSGTTFQTSSYINALFTYATTGSNVTGSSSAIAITNTTGANTVYNASGHGGYCGSYFVFNPTSTAFLKKWIGSGTYFDSASSPFYTTYGSGAWINAAALDGFRIKASSGNIASGVVKVYGLK